MQKNTIGRIFFAIRLLHSKEQLRRRERNEHAANLGHIDGLTRFVLRDAACGDHQIDLYVVGNPDHGVIADIIVAQFEDRFVG